MPLYYDRGLPSEKNKNSITRTATDFGIRDFLLRKNIIDPIKYPQLYTSFNGSPKGGEPVLDTMVGTGVVIPQVSLEIDGVFRYGNAILMNHYKNDATDAPKFEDVDNLPKVPIYPESQAGTGNYKDEELDKFGLLAKTDFKEFRKQATLRNLYVDSTKQIDVGAAMCLQPVQSAQQLESYLDEYGGLNLGQSGSIRAADILGTTLNGQGIGIGQGGLETNFDIRASLAGRVLTATGLLNDTKLGVIAGQQLALSLANNATFNVQQELLGKLNVSDNILSLFKNGTLAGFRPDYKITVPTSTGGKILDYAERILGFQIPRSYLPESGSIFQTESGPISNIDRANQMLDATGKGQIRALALQFEANLNGTSSFDKPSNSHFRTGYSPRYQKGSEGDFIVSGQVPKLYAFNDAPNSGFVYPFASSDDIIPELNWNRDKMIEESGFGGFDNNTYSVNDGRPFATKFSWNSGDGNNVNGIDNFDEFVGDKKTILGKTQKLFNSVGMKSLLSVKGDKKVTTKSQIQSSVSPNGFISKGSGVLSGSKFNSDGSLRLGSGDTPDNTFCRSWTSYNRYDTMGKLIRHRGLNQNEDGGEIIKQGGKLSGWRQNTAGSVLDDNGMVKIAPYKTDNLTRQATAPKKYMFSIENLAWVGTPAVNLLPSEQGPGDLLTGKFGKIMWFPPYDINFSETSSLNIESNQFIGRGEPIYTYNNTERTGNLSFKIVVDHPTIMNSFAGDSRVTDEFIDSYFAGCVDLDGRWSEKLTGLEKSTIESKQVINVPKKNVTLPKKPDDFKIYFKNDISAVDSAYESGVSSHIKNGVPYRGLGNYNANTKYTLNNKQRVWPDSTDFGLNKQLIKIGGTTYDGWISATYLEDLKNYLENVCTTCKAKVAGHASSQGFSKVNTVLSTDRANAVIQYLVGAGIQANRLSVDTAKSGTLSGAYTPDTSVDQKAPKADRYASVTFYYDQTQIESPREIQETRTITTTSVNQTIKRRFYTESDFFEKLTDEDPLVFDKIRDKIKFFHPAFHSTTPEGLNSRLTFLLQCTRQGPTIPGVEATNLAFGPAPVCILRVGDFYNTKIIMDNVSFDFEPLVWDLNPEGIGVQPMIANVNISFKFIGGSSLQGPINMLQNALSFNYFANTHVYDVRADYVAKVSDIQGSKLDASRKTFGTNNQTEPNYTLVKGLDITTTSMQTAVSDEVIPTTQPAPSINQVATADVVNSTPAVTTTSSATGDLPRLKITNIELTAYNIDGNLNFTVARKNAGDSSNLVKDYTVIVTISNKLDNSVSHQIKLPTKLLASSINQPFSFNLSDMTSPCSVIDNSNYALRVDLVGLGKLNENIT